MNRVEQWLHDEGASRRPVADRVAELLVNISRGAQRYAGESWDQANERHAEEFISRLRDEFPGNVFEVSRPPAFEHQERIVRRLLGDATLRRGGRPPALAEEPISPRQERRGSQDEGAAESPEGDASPGAPSSTAAAGAGGNFPVVLVERQKLKPIARRTTSFNYVFTVPGRSPQRLVLVAHYDTWRGPGADDNTTGEEIVKQYLLDDLRAAAPPPLTHTYILAGSEECGLIGFTSQVLLAVGLGVANMALTKGIYVITALGIAMVPLAKFRFGVSGSREYVSSLSPEEMALVKSVISVDSVGEGKMYIPESSLGADFVRAFIPFEGYHDLNDLLEEAAHLHGIRYNTFIAGGTTDHVSFLEVNSSFRDLLGDWLGCPRWLGCHKHGKRKIPASALVALNPGKASPLVFGGKIHTPADTPDRVYPQPLAEALRITDYWFHLMHGGARIADPRDPDEYHYAQLYRVRLSPGAGPRLSRAEPRGARVSGVGAGPRARPEPSPLGGIPGEKIEFWLAMKDAVEPNRRNINGLYRVEAEIAGDLALCRNPHILDWGVHTRLRREVAERLGDRGSFQRLRVRQLELETPQGTLRFAARGAGWWGMLNAVSRNALGQFERFLGSNTFLAFFGAAYLLAKGVDLAMTAAFVRSFAFQQWFFEWFAITLPVTVALQLWAVLWLIGTKIPTMIDNNYKHLNKADNLRSLRRVAN